MGFIMRIVNMILRMLGLGQVARLNTQAHQFMNAAAPPAAPPAPMGGAPMAPMGGAPMAPMGGAPMGGSPYFDQNAQNAMVQQAMVQAQQQHQQRVNSAAANPALTAPIEGVTIEQYAQLTARAAQNLPPAQFEQLLMQAGMDRAKYDRVAAGWNARMREDTSFALTTIYGQAFGGAGAGQFGAAASAGVGSMAATGATGVAHGVAGGEPVSWEKYNEIGGAQRAWAASGKDVNAMLQQQFGVSALDWSNMSQYWMARMMTDPQKMMEMNGLQEQWAARYAAPKADQDLKF
jgi:hypothetical protein